MEKIHIDLNQPLLVGREALVRAYECAPVEKALEQTGGNVSKAAELAGVDRKFVQRGMRQHRLKKPLEGET